MNKLDFRSRAVKELKESEPEDLQKLGTEPELESGKMSAQEQMQRLNLIRARAEKLQTISMPKSGDGQVNLLAYPKVLLAMATIHALIQRSGPVLEIAEIADQTRAIADATYGAMLGVEAKRRKRRKKRMAKTTPRPKGKQ